MMFYRQYISAFPTAPRRPVILKQTEVFRTMPSPSSQSENFEQLALPLLASLYNHAVWLTRDQVEAEDLVQEALAKALRAFDSFEPGTNFKAWTFRILRNTFLTSRSGIAAARTVFLEDQLETVEFADSTATPEEMAIRLDDHEALFTAIEHLPPNLREALLLCDVEDLKYKEIAAILEVPVGTVMSRIARARQTLRGILQSRGRRSL